MRVQKWGETFEQDYILCIVCESTTAQYLHQSAVTVIAKSMDASQHQHVSPQVAGSLLRLMSEGDWCEILGLTWDWSTLPWIDYDLALAILAGWHIKGSATEADVIHRRNAVHMDVLHYKPEGCK